MNFAKFLGTPFLQNMIERLLLTSYFLTSEMKEVILLFVDNFSFITLVEFHF